METTQRTFETIDEYIAKFPPHVQDKLREMRQLIRETAPDAYEKISYQIPTFDLYGNLVHFAAFKHHIGFYPAPGALEEFKDELATYKGAKGSVQFPLDQPLPLDLVRRIVEYRIAENMKKAAGKKQRR